MRRVGCEACWAGGQPLRSGQPATGPQPPQAPQPPGTPATRRGPHLRHHHAEHAGVLLPHTQPPRVAAAEALRCAVHVCACKGGQQDGLAVAARRARQVPLAHLREGRRAVRGREGRRCEAGARGACCSIVRGGARGWLPKTDRHSSQQGSVLSPVPRASQAQVAAGLAALQHGAGATRRLPLARSLHRPAAGARQAASRAAGGRRRAPVRRCSGAAVQPGAGQSRSSAPA
jgi:hypothetical protein